MSTDQTHISEQITFSAILKTAATASGLNHKQITQEIAIPYRTFQDWLLAKRTPPAYVQKLVLDRVQNISAK